MFRVLEMYNFVIREKNMKPALQILTSQTKLGVQPEQTEMENMLEQEEIMDFVGIVVQKFDKKINKS